MSEASLALLEMIEPEKKFWSLYDLAKFWGVSYKCIQNAAREGSLPGCSRLPSGRYQVDSEIVTREWAPPSMRGWLGLAALEAPEPSEAEARAEIEVTREMAREAKAIETRVTSILEARVAAGPKPITVDERLSSLSQAVTGGHWVAIVRKAISQATGGDWRARQWLSNYLLGPPIQRLVAEVAIREVEGFEVGFRAAAIKTLLGQVRDRAESKIIDVVPVEVEDATS